MKTDFDLFVAVDWSGARGEFHKGISVAVCEPGNSAPWLIKPKNRWWSREGVIKVLNELAEKNRVLCGFDFSFSSPYLDKGCYFPLARTKEAPALWRTLEDICDKDDHLACSSFIAHSDYRDLFLTGARRGANFEARFRVCERLCRERGLGRAESLFHLVGPSQVGCASLTGMRALLRLENYTIWPFNRRGMGSVAVEIFTRLFLTQAAAGGRKITRLADLNAALEKLGSEAAKRVSRLDDHKADAIVSAAGLRQLATNERAWKPSGMSKIVRKTEGWTFGVF